MINRIRTKLIVVTGLAVLLVVVALILWRPFGSSSPSKSDQNQIVVVQRPRIPQWGTWTTLILPPEREVQFPEDRSIGELYVRDWNSTMETLFSSLGEAQGTVTVPFGKELRLRIDGLLDQDLSPLAELGEHDLQLLSLSGMISPIFDASIGTVTGIETNSTFTDGDLRFIRELRSLRQLQLIGASISDAGLLHLRSLSRLEHLHIMSTSITDKGLAYLQSMRSLKTLILSGTQITPNGLASLKRALPNCAVSVQSFAVTPTPTPTPPTRPPVS